MRPWRELSVTRAVISLVQASHVVCMYGNVCHVMLRSILLMCMLFVRAALSVTTSRSSAQRVSKHIVSQQRDAVPSRQLLVER
jgi:hypothetical protein